MVPNRFCLVRIVCSLSCGISLMHSLDAQQQCGELDMADSISTMAEMTLKVEATSPLQCAFSCLQRPGCKCLCFSVTTSECHVGDEMTSVSLALTTTASHHCFCRRCPTERGYMKVRGECVKLHTDMLNHTEAAAACQSECAHLYHFKSLVRDSPVVANLTALSGASVGMVWLGASNSATEGQFVWSDGSVLPSDSNLWKTDEPNNSNGNEDCVELQVSAFRFNDNTCSKVNPFICQT